jgi:hypothetical protein
MHLHPLVPAVLFLSTDSPLLVMTDVNGSLPVTAIVFILIHGYVYSQT